MAGIISKITSALSSDIVFLLVLFGLVFLCSMYFGKNKIVSVILAFYPAAFLYNNFPYTEKFIFLDGDSGLVISKILIFLAFLFIVYIAVARYVSLYDESSGNLMKAGLSASVVVLTLLFSYTIVNFDVLHNFSPLIDSLFTGTGRVFGWGLVPFVLLWLI